MKTIHRKYYFIVLIGLLTITACKKEINLDLVNVSGKLVIEANVTNTPGPQYVVLTRNVAFTSPNVYPPVTGAAVSITDNSGNNYPLTEGPAGTYSTNSLMGSAGNTYTLSVTTGGQTYTAQSTMPQVVTLDSITSKANLIVDNKGQKMITAYFQDPPNVANQYNLLLYVNGVQVKSIFAINDEFLDGKYVTLDLQQNDIDIYAGDTVKVVMQCIDEPIYKYWFTLAQQQANNPGGQVAPANPPTNITPATLGYFSAHTTQSITLVVK